MTTTGEGRRGRGGRQKTVMMDDRHALTSGRSAMTLNDLEHAGPSFDDEQARVVSSCWTRFVRRYTALFDPARQPTRSRWNASDTEWDVTVVCTILLVRRGRPAQSAPLRSRPCN